MMKSAHQLGVVRALSACIGASLLGFALAGCGGGGGSAGTGDATIAVVEQPSAPTPKQVHGEAPSQPDVP